MVRKYKVAIPHWRWPVLATVLSLLAYAALIAVIFNNDVNSPLFLITTLLFILVMFIDYAVCLWWLWQFGKGVEKITQGGVPLGWTIAYIILLGPITLYMLQYHFNRLPKSANSGAKKHTPSKKFVVGSIVAMIIVTTLSTIAGVALSALSDTAIVAEPDQQSKELKIKEAKANSLYDQYISCVAALNNKYPDDDSIATNEEIYSKDYDSCEAVRTRQNAAADDYNKSIGQ